MYYDNVHIYTDTSKDPEANKTGISIVIPHLEVIIAKRTADYVSVFTTELIAIVLALHWLEETPIKKAVFMLRFTGGSKKNSDGTIKLQTRYYYRNNATAIGFTLMTGLFHFYGSQHMLEKMEMRWQRNTLRDR